MQHTVTQMDQMLSRRGLEPQLHRTKSDGHYESFYLRAHEPGGGRAFWIKYTLLRRPGQPVMSSVWCMYFDRDLPRPLAVKQTFAQEELVLEQGETILAMGGSSLSLGLSLGQIAYADRSASWQLSFDEGAPPFFYSARPKLYSWRVPRSKALVPTPQTLFNGSVEICGRSVDVSGWPGMVGHNWGSEHARRWVWLNCNEFTDRESDCYFDGAAARTHLGGWLTPWLSTGMISVDGQRFEFNKLSCLLKGEVDEGYTSCVLQLHLGDAQLKAEVSAPSNLFVGLVYRDPDGCVHNTLNCSLADVSVEFQRQGSDPIKLSSNGGGSYEIGLLETDHPVPVEPFDD